MRKLNSILTYTPQATCYINYLCALLPHRRLDQALSADERGDRMKALELYNVVLSYISRALKNESGQAGQEGYVTQLEK